MKNARRNDRQAFSVRWSVPLREHLRHGIRRFLQQHR